jgi:hypothetical protein
MAAQIERLTQEQKANPGTISMLLPRIVPDAANWAEPFPLTEIQQAYWIGRSDVLELGNVGAHFYLELEAGSLDPARLERAWQQLIIRHGMLRAVVLPDGRQKLLEPAPQYRIKTLNVADLPKPEANRVLAEVRAEISHQLQSGERWPPFEIRLTHIAAERTRLHVSLDILMIDLWSLRLLMREWLALYEDPSTELPRLEIAFRDYVLAVAALEQTQAWQR